MVGVPLRSSFGQTLVATTIVLVHVGLTCTVHAQRENKQVLVLYSTRPDAQLSIVGERKLPRILDLELAQNIIYYSEFIDASTFPERAHDALLEFLRLKYEGIRFDLVIALQDAAIEFVQRERDSVFRDTPAVFLTNNPTARRLPKSTGLIHRRDFGATLEFLRQLQPDVRNLFIITGADASAQPLTAAIRELQHSQPELTFTYLSGLPTNDLEDRLSRLPPHSAVYYLWVSQDGAGQKFHPLEYLDRIAPAANAPIYCWVDSAMDHGIVGGSLYRQEDAIERIGQLAVRVLRGEPAESIPIATLSLNTNMVDWRQLRRWHIDAARIPAGTLVRFREPTMWDRYKIHILAAVTLLVTQAVLITGLLIQRRRRRRAEEQLRGSQQALHGSYERIRDLGAGLLRAQETERARIARELHDDICQRMLLLTLELESLTRSDADKVSATTALTAAREIATSLHELSHQLHPTRLRLVGLVAALDQLCLELSGAGVSIEFTHDNVPSPVSPDVMLCLFRVVQEGVQNAIKHGNASKLSVHLSGASDRLTLMIIDNGVGFDVNAVSGKGVGLMSMTERLEAIGGSIQVHSNPGAGTRLSAAVPTPVA
jgi:signal transduction histidine kinase